MIVDPFLRGQVAAGRFQLPQCIDGSSGMERNRVRTQNALWGKMKSIVKSGFWAEIGGISEV